MKKLLISFFIGRPGLLRSASMHAMFRFRRPASKLKREYRFVRTLQAIDHIEPDKLSGKWRISSKAFGPSSSDGKLSGDLEECLVQDGLAATVLYPAVDRAVGAASLLIGEIQDENLQIVHDPVSANWYHGSVSGHKGNVKKRLAAKAVEIIPIDQKAASEWAVKRQQSRSIST